MLEKTAFETFALNQAKVWESEAEWIKGLSNFFSALCKGVKANIELSHSAKLMLSNEGVESVSFTLPEILFWPQQGDEIELDVNGKSLIFIVVKKRIKAVENDVPLITFFLDSAKQQYLAR